MNYFASLFVFKIFAADCRLLLLYFYYEFVHKVHNKEKMKNKRREKIKIQNNNTLKTAKRHQTFRLSSALLINHNLNVCDCVSKVFI